MVNFIRYLGQIAINAINELGRSGLFLLRFLFKKPQFTQDFSLLIKELYSVGILSLLIIVVSGLFIGMVLSLQGFNTLEKFGAESELGSLVALSMVRELGPVISALLFAGRAGSALTAEIGLMKATEQLDSMEMLGVDPLHRIIAPRFWAGFISLPLLATMFNVVGIFGAFAVGTYWLGADTGIFWSNMQSGIQFSDDIVSGLIKSLFFGFVVSWIAVHQGYDCEPTAEGISRATTRTVVFSSLAVLGLDFVLTALMIGDW